MDRSILIVEDDLQNVNDLIEFIIGEDHFDYLKSQKNLDEIYVSIESVKFGLLWEIEKLREKHNLIYNFKKLKIARTLKKALEMIAEDVLIVFLDLFFFENSLNEKEKYLADKFLENLYSKILPENRPLIIIFSRLLENEEYITILQEIAEKYNALSEINFLNKNIFFSKPGDELLIKTKENIMKVEWQNLATIFYLYLYTKPPYLNLTKLKNIYGKFKGILEFSTIISNKDYKIIEFENEIKDYFSKYIFKEKVLPNLKNEYENIKCLIMHSPGKEVEAVTLENKEKCLFDQPINVQKALYQHKKIKEAIEKKGGNVILIRDIIFRLLEDDNYGKYLRAKLLWETKIITSFDIEKYWELLDYFKDKDTDDFIDFIFSGIFPKDGKEIFTPTPNFMFTRDWGFCIHNNFYFSKMAKPIRQREVALAKFAISFSGIIPQENLKEVTKGTLEGGDVLLPKDDTVFLGMSERTDLDAIESLIEDIFLQEGINKVIVIYAPYAHIRSMHLDTYIGFINSNTCIVFKDYLNSKFISIEYNRDKKDPVLKFKTLKKLLEENGFDNFVEVTDPREQYDDACNVFTIKPSQFLIYERVEQTINTLEEIGNFKIDKCEGDELVLARGGPHCLTLPIIRIKNK